MKKKEMNNLLIRRFINVAGMLFFIFYSGFLLGIGKFPYYFLTLIMGLLFGSQVDKINNKLIDKK